MKIVNKTQWRTEDLRKLFLAGMRERGTTHDLTVTVGYSRTGRVTGRARYGRFYDKVGPHALGSAFRTRYVPGHTMTIRLPAPGRVWKLRVDGRWPEQEIAAVFMHELAHNLGVRHRDMHPDLRHCKQEITWADPTLSIRKAEPKLKPDKAITREEHSREKVVELTSRIKRLTTQLRKWKDKVRYYDRKKAAAKGTR